MKEIRTVHSEERQSFDREVNKLLSEGWKMNGPVHITTLGTPNQDENRSPYLTLTVVMEKED